MNRLLKGLAFDNQISFCIIEATQMVNRAIKIHNLSPLAAASLGRTLIAGTFISSNLKNDKDKMSVVISGDGIGGKITVCGDGSLNMRGTIDNPHASLTLKNNGKLDVAKCVGKNGRLTVIKSMGLKEQYSGSCELVSGEIAQDFTAYFAYSEQIPTTMTLGVNIGNNGKCSCAWGVVLQALPFASEDTLKNAEKMINSLQDISSKIEKDGVLVVLNDLFGNVEYCEYKPKYHCKCSKSYINSVLCALGKKELEDIIAKEGQIKVCCQFCDKQYIFYKDDIEKLF